MAVSPTPIYYILAAVFLILVAAFRKGKRCPALPLPPGPKPLPVIGNILDMPTKRLAPILRDMGKHYGDITYFNLLGQPMIILNTYEAAVEMLERRSANTSDRPRLVMAEIAGFMWEFTLLGYTQAWRERRRMFHRFFNHNVVSEYRPIHLRESHRFLQRLMDAPQDIVELSRHLFGATIMDVAYGIQVAEENDPYIALARRSAAVFTDIVIPGKYLAEVIPLLKHLPSWFPGAASKRDIRRRGADVSPLRDMPYEATLAAMSRGDARSSIVASMIDRAIRGGKVMSPDEDECLRDITGIAYLTGTDTTLLSSQAFFLAMVQNPDIQRKAQEELDLIVGSDRLPEFHDRPLLPYVNAVVKEVTRWHSVVPLGVAHRTLGEDEYNGCRIPTGSILVANAWAMSRDSEAYPNPDIFDPERFIIGDDEKNEDMQRDPAKFQFGFGRRICPGRHFSNDALFIMIASVLHVFSIEPPVGEDGKPVHENPGTVLDFFLSYLEPFQCRFIPRSQKAETLIRNGIYMDVE
ncbi:CyP450 monooxygenase [Trametes meyenii]|nr:CyP450 monooxygenase [Trametes meyenii]